MDWPPLPYLNSFKRLKYGMCQLGLALTLTEEPGCMCQVHVDVT
jgi:hypothetical protein